MATERAVLTIAVGKPLYLQLAINLARSFLFWHRRSDIIFCIATDRATALPPDLSDIFLIRLEPGRFGSGFSPKLHLDELAPADRTLFIDADCLCVGSLETVFRQFEGCAVSVVGGSISEGEWFGDVVQLCRHFSVVSLPKFNGGIYYLEPGQLASAVYQRARELESEYDALGLVRLRGRPNDELLVSIAMAEHGLAALPDDGTILSSPYEAPLDLQVDVYKGRSSLINPPPPHPLHRSWYPLGHVQPLVVHFLGDYHRRPEYRAEAFKLRVWRGNRLVRRVARFLSFLSITLPGRCVEASKDLLRPLYRVLVGTRAVRPSERIG